jgi:hypothetical protein
MKLDHAVLNIIKRAALIALASGAITVTHSTLEARDQVPFRAEYDTELEAVVNFPLASVFATGEGQATHLGRMVTQSIEETVNLATGEGVASYIFSTANGDEIVIEFAFSAIPSGASFAVSGTWEITGGTGRFDGASGSGTYKGRVEFTGLSSAVGHFKLEGTISSPGSLK